ncbi:MAG: hypothetical protein HW394_813, partial [Acidobacteria bacterium]|nr:hypothetical protein [Acidobacteriota bacterium]
MQVFQRHTRQISTRRSWVGRRSVLALCISGFIAAALYSVQTSASPERAIA